jgi:EmrB/QacA subfamily drug resistance transporter
VALTAVSRPAHRVTIFAVVALALMLTTIDQTIVATALPSITRSLNTSIAWGGWIITAYSLGLIVVMPLAGKASDQFGRRKLFFAAVITFGIGSLACSLSDNIALLIVFRGMQALGGGSITPTSAGIISDTFADNRDRALGAFSVIFPLGAVFGPIVGGGLLRYWSWPFLFAVNVPICLVVLVVGARVIPADGARRGTSIDIVGAGLLASSLLAWMFGISSLSSSPLLSIKVLPAQIFGFALMVGFVRHTRRSAAPLIPPFLLWSPTFGAINLVNVFAGAATIGFTALVPVYAQARYGLSPLVSGSVLTTRALGMLSTSGLTVLLMRRIGFRRPLALGFLLMAAALLLTALAPPFGLSPFAWLSISGLVCGVGMGICTPASNVAAIHLAPESAAAITGLRGMFRQSGALVSIAVITSILGGSAVPGSQFSAGFVVFAVLLGLATSLVAFVPNDSRTKLPSRDGGQ